jgi:DNA-binding transcriptional ArsR family regulator
MKSFYGVAAGQGREAASETVAAATYIPSRARVAVYEGAGSAPRVEEISSRDVDEYIEALASRVYELARERGGDIPYTVIREVSENLIHADFAEPVVSILDGGATVRFADQGPGIVDKERALLPGFTTAQASMKRYIRGVGSGFPIVKDYLSLSGGDLQIEDNLGCGSVVTVRSGRACSARPVSANRYFPPETSRPAASSTIQVPLPDTTPEVADQPAATARPRLSTRQKQVLALVMESGSAGPSLVAADLGVALSTAYRDLASLEELGLITADAGKRRLTEEGLEYLKDMTSGH